VTYSRTISHLTEASILLGATPRSPMWPAYDCGCRSIPRLNEAARWNLCSYHSGFDDGIDALAAALEAERDGAR